MDWGENGKMMRNEVVDRTQEELVMPENHVEEQLAELTRRVEALEVRLAEIDALRALREAGPTYRVGEERNEISLFEARLRVLAKQFSELIEDWQDVRAMLEAEVDYRAGDAVSFDDFFSELEAEAE